MQNRSCPILEKNCMQGEGQIDSAFRSNHSLFREHLHRNLVVYVLESCKYFTDSNISFLPSSSIRYRFRQPPSLQIHIISLATSMRYLKVADLSSVQNVLNTSQHSRLQLKLFGNQVYLPKQSSHFADLIVHKKLEYMQCVIFIVMSSLSPNNRCFPHHILHYCLRKRSFYCTRDHCLMPYSRPYPQSHNFVIQVLQCHIWTCFILQSQLKPIITYIHALSSCLKMKAHVQNLQYRALLIPFVLD